MRLVCIRGRAGFTLVESLIAMLIVAMSSIGTVSAVIYSRNLAEYDKQRLSAISVARRYIEEAQRHVTLAGLTINSLPLDDFNTPDDLTDDLNATLERHVYALNADGSRGAEVVNPAAIDLSNLYEVVVTVSWERTGNRSGRPVTEELQTYIAPKIED